MRFGEIAYKEPSPLWRNENEFGGRFVTPSDTVAAVYGVLQILDVVYDLFIALALVSAVRGIWLNIYGAKTPGRVTGQQKKAAASGD